MGDFKPEFVIGIITHSPEKTRELDSFVEKHPHLFTKSGELTNGHVNYIMFWDGSKEWWDDSNEGDRLRKIFIALLSQIECAKIYHIVDHVDREPTVTKTFIYSEWMKKHIQSSEVNKT